MKTKRLLAAILVSCGIVAFATAQALAQQSAKNLQTEQLVIQPLIHIGMTGLQYGSVDIRVSNNGQTYSYTSSTNGYIGEFTWEGSSCEFEVTFNNTSPSFNRLTTSANLVAEKISDNKYHVTLYDPDMKWGEIALHFGQY